MNTITELMKQNKCEQVSPLVWCGLAILVVGTIPLDLTVMAACLGLIRDPNLMSPGLLATVTFWPGIGMIVAGAVRSIRHRREAPCAPAIPA
jgi:hypothetical protein